MHKPSPNNHPWNKETPANDDGPPEPPDDAAPPDPLIRESGVRDRRTHPDAHEDPVTEAYRLYAHGLLRRFQKKGIGPDSASGLVQEVFLHAHVVIAEEGRPASFPRLLTRIAKFVLSNYWRVRRRRPACADVDDAEIPASKPNAEQQVGNAEEIEMVLVRLPEEMAEVIRLIDLAEKTPEEVGAMLGHPATTIRSRHTRALAKFGEVAVQLQKTGKLRTR